MASLLSSTFWLITSLIFNGFNGSNAMLCRYKMHICTHVSAHNFLNIQWISIRKKFWNVGNQGYIKSYMSIVSNMSTVPVHYCIEILRLVSTAFQNFFRIENPLNIKKVMGRNMCVCICILYRLYRHNIAFEPLKHDVL